MLQTDKGVSTITTYVSDCRHGAIERSEYCLTTYDDLNGSVVALPMFGLRVTGSISVLYQYSHPIHTCLVDSMA